MPSTSRKPASAAAKGGGSRAQSAATRLAAKPPAPAPEPALYDLDRAVAALPETFLQCRDFGHSWRPFAVRWIARENRYEQVLRCGRCESERIRHLGRRGQILDASYEYPDGYLMPGSGRLSTEDRDSIRLRSAKLTEIRDTVEE